MHFTDHIAQYIFTNQLQIQHLTIVLPSERAKKYIASSLFKAHGKALIAPEMITINQWVKQLSSKTIIDKTRVLVQLYYAQEDSNAVSFDEFMSWGTILLSDFDDIDRYLLDANQVFKNLSDIKDLEAWNVDEDKLSETQKKFLEFWETLPELYVELKKRLDEKNNCFAGTAYKEVANNIDLVFKKDNKRHFIFAGFNALSKAELSIIKQLHTMGRGHILINADTFYLDNSTHEAGEFLRQLKKELNVNSLPFVENTLLSAAKNIEVVECAQTTGQVKVASTKLMSLSSSEISETLILLADESLITPLLKNLPSNIGKANITLGMPLKASSLRNWIDILFSIQESKQRFKTNALYYNDLQRLLNHPFILASSDKVALRNAQKLEQDIIRYNKIFSKQENIRISEEIDKILSLLNQDWKNDWLEAVRIIRQLNNLIFKNLSEESQFEKALLDGFDKAIIDFENILKEGFPEINLRTFKSLLNQHWNGKSIAYHGNPTDGLQIMGLLETRLLDFKRIICLGLNEGSMPPINQIQTMIPMDLRKHLGLPTPREKQGLFAHHFYRLLHTCEDLLVTYTSSSEAIGSNEQSRYLLQLELELSRQNPNIHFSRKFYTVPMIDDEDKSIRKIEKSDEIVQRLDQLFAKSISASALKNYTTCPLDFYYKYVLEFGEEDGVEEAIENNTFGTFIHETLEDLFSPFAKRGSEGKNQHIAAPQVTERDINKMLQVYETILSAKFASHFGNDKEAYATGKNLLSFQMASELTKNFLMEQRKLVIEKSVFVDSLEEEFIHELTLDIHGIPKKIRLKGFVDRIDRVDGRIRIIDYKSGVVKPENVTIKYTVKDDLTKKVINEKHTLQLLTYCYLYKMKYGVQPSEVGIYSFVKNQAGFLNLSFSSEDLDFYINKFPEILTELIENVYDPLIPFEHTVRYEEHSYCSYCN